MIKFFRGLKANYAGGVGETHRDGIYFATDTKELLMNNNAYGIPYTYDDSTLDGRLDTVEAAIQTLNGTSSTQGSVAYQIAQIVNDNNNGDIDTLNEIAAWIINDTTGAAKMASDISSLQTAVGAIDYSGKADKVTSGTENNFAALDANGNIKDAGVSASSFQAAGSYKTTQSAVSDPSASGNAAAFIDSISQNAQGVITVTKKNVQAASASQNGLMSSSDFSKLSAIASGAQVNVIETIKVGTAAQPVTDKAVTLGTAAGAATTDFDAAGSAASAESAAKSYADGLLAWVEVTA